MSHQQEFEERVLRMAQRNGLQHQILQNGTITLFLTSFSGIKVHVSRAARPCRVTIQFADGSVSREPWALLESVCRNLAAGRRS